MVLKVLIETIIVTLLFEGFVVALILKKGPMYMISDYPPAIKQRVVELGMMPDEKQIAKEGRIHDIFGFTLMAVLYLVPIIVINGERTFWPAFIQSYIFGNAISWFDALVLDCLWFCHSKFCVIKGTEDMTKEYKDYWFHIKFAVQGIVLLVIPSAIMGGITALVGLILK